MLIRTNILHVPNLQSGYFLFQIFLLMLLLGDRIKYYKFLGIIAYTRTSVPEREEKKKHKGAAAQDHQ